MRMVHPDKRICKVVGMNFSRTILVKLLWMAGYSMYFIERAKDIPFGI